MSKNAQDARAELVGERLTGDVDKFITISGRELTKAQRDYIRACIDIAYSEGFADACKSYGSF